MMEQEKKGAGSPKGVRDWKRDARALGRQIDDPEALAQGYEILAALETELHLAALRLMTEHTAGSRPFSYEDLARPFGFTRQAARKRWPLVGPAAERLALIWHPKRGQVEDEAAA